VASRLVLARSYRLPAPLLLEYAADALGDCGLQVKRPFARSLSRDRVSGAGFSREEKYRFLGAELFAAG
jgi:hypothetical protein